MQKSCPFKEKIENTNVFCVFCRTAMSFKVQAVKFAKGLDLSKPKPVSD